MSTLLKDRLADDSIAHIASVFVAISSYFDAAKFADKAQHGLAELELKQRVNHLIEALAACLPHDFSQAALLLQQVPDYWQINTVQDDYGFTAWPIIDYVAVYGLQHPDLALQTLKILTPLFTAEFAIRPFLIHHFELAYGYLQQWTQDDNYHVRRLASEACRPRLPWGLRVPSLMRHHAAIIAILEHLKDDESDYVQRSVANNLNDISKDHPDVVVALAQQWLTTEPTPQRQWIVKHATRALVKQGHAATLALLGFCQQVSLKNVAFSVSQPQIIMGDSVQLSLSFLLLEPQNLVIDYALHLPRANGKKSRKVFKWRTGLFAAGEHQLLQNYGFKLLTTRRYYQGEHVFEVLVNGQSLGLQTLYLVLT